MRTEARRASPPHGKSSSARTHRKSSLKARQTKTTSTGSVWSAPRSSRDRKSLCASGTGLPTYTHTCTHPHTHTQRSAYLKENRGPLRRYKFCEIDLDEALGPVLDNLERISCHRCARAQCPAITCLRSCVCVCVCKCVPESVRACVCVCLRACVHACVLACVRACVRALCVCVSERAMGEV